MNIEENADTEDFLEHFGVKGMHWGVRRGAGVEGVSRSRGAIMDRNNVNKQILTNAREGSQYKIAKGIGIKLLGSEQWERNFQKSVSDINAQNDRLKSGNLIKSDKVDVFLTNFRQPGGLVLARRTKVAGTTTRRGLSDRT